MYLPTKVHKYKYLETMVNSTNDSSSVESLIQKISYLDHVTNGDAFRLLSKTKELSEKIMLRKKTITDQCN